MPMKKTASQILKNSLPNVSEKSQSAASSFLALASMFGKKDEKNMNPNDMLKRNIKEFVFRVRKFGETFESSEEGKKEGSRISKEDLPDLAVAWIIVVMSTAFAIGVGAGIYGVLGAFGAMFTTYNLFVVGVFIVLVMIFTGAISVALPEV